MKYYSTSRISPATSMKTAVLQGLAPDRGLYMPEWIPCFSSGKLDELKDASFSELAFEIAKPFLGNELDESRLQEITEQSFTFKVPLVRLNNQTYILELFEGPTLAFKDFGARFMARLTGAFAEEDNKLITVLVATSGDTGSAVAYGFKGVPNTRVVILYPSGKVSRLQEQQLTTAGGNVTALEVSGDFDACQKLVKEAFADAELRSSLTLTSANSINIARLLPQSFYYAYASLQLKKKNPDAEIVFTVPSGNFGNLTAGIFAKKMGFPIKRFIAASNKNDSVPRYLETGSYEPHATIETLSTAMDVGNPSNFARMLDIYDSSVRAMSDEITGYSVSDAETRETMRVIYDEMGYLLDPHTAVGVTALGKERAKNQSEKEISVVLSTAHPAKFVETVRETLEFDMQIPERLANVLNLTKQSTPIANDFQALKSLLLSLPC
ncbi:threonine synthase [Chloroherpeton thalassium ATCC 35110]|uniref:Threonine synthase n=1 Tax=Chloroherpeton thalassium (strain ATCC 35110 / GB-78) TaxID=517418 RepID=B3QWX3_CHLT3|nr:threonine synthase [Chloroherpeton thalassium]ACF13337.1 threonine synthase [Chloroherpeton thalassium ATCC 35110]